MKTMPIGRALRAALLSSAALFASAVTAHAQQAQTAQNQNIEEIVVTGTRIQREDLIAASPIAVVSSADIKAAGVTNVEDYLRYAPQMAQAFGSNTNNGNPGAATADLRRLGTNRTLVLVDGKRFPPYDANGRVDLNNVPTSLIDRVDIVTGGASATYGSDAIAGVVNFILKRDFKGVQGDGQYGVSEHGDAVTWNMNSTAGGNLADGKGNFVINVDYTQYQPLYQGSRAFSLSSLDPGTFGPGGSTTAEETTLLGLTKNANTDSSGRAQFNSSGNLVPLFSRFNFNPFNLLQSPMKKWNATALGHYSITDNIEFYTNALFTDSRVETIIASTGTFNFPFNINYRDNAFLSAQAKGVLALEDTAARGDPNPGDGVVTLSVGRRLTEMGTRNSVYEGTTYRIVNGLKGDFGDTNQYHWDIFGQYGRTMRTIELQNDFNYAKLQQAILAVRNASGTIVCTDTSGGCVPANIWGKGNLSPAAAAFVRFNLEETDVASQLVTGGSISGDLPFAVGDAKPGGFAGGIEYRREASQSRPDDNLVNGNAPGFGSSTPVNAKYEVKEFYGETIVPLMQGQPGFQALNIEAGARYASYNSVVVGTATNKFNNWSYKVGGDWSPDDMFRVRGMYQRAVRAPAIQEIGLPRTPGTGDADTDPCAGTGPTGNASLTALCVATGVPAARIGSVSGPISGQVNNYTGGNPALTPEKANTITAGLVFTPQAVVPRLSATLDYYHIKVNNAIIQLPEQSILNACYVYDKSASSPFCQRVHRNPLNGSLVGGTETGVDAAYVNAASYLASGIDFGVHYGFDLSDNMGSLNLGIDGSYVLESKERDASFLPERDCKGLAGLTCKRPDPIWRFTQTTGWAYGPLDLQMHIRFVSGLTQDSIKLSGVSPASFVKPTIPAYAYFDVQGSYAITDFFTVRAGVINLTDKDPPVVGTGWGGTAENSGNTLPATYDPIGRRYYFGATVRF